MIDNTVPVIVKIPAEILYLRVNINRAILDPQIKTPAIVKLTIGGLKK